MTTETTSLKVLVVDDEPGARALLQTLLVELPLVASVDCAADNSEARAILKRVAIDLIVLDIEMPGGTGFELLHDQAAELKASVLFATSHGQYALKAIPWRPFGYLLKPIDPDELSLAVERVVHARTNFRNQAGPDHIELHTLNEHHYIALDDIRYLEGDGAYTTVHLKEGRKILVSRNLGQLEQKLPMHRFFRCHRSYIVPLQQVSSFVLTDGGMLLLKEGQRIPIASRKHAAFEQAMRRSTGSNAGRS